jgi:hypothetical protein
MMHTPNLGGGQVFLRAGGVLLLTAAEETRGLRRGKTWRLRVARARRLKKSLDIS